MDNIVRFLVIRFSSIGDIVLTTPVLRHIQEQVEGDVEIHFLTKAVMKPILEHNPRIHQVHTIETSTAEVMDELKNLQIDYVIDLHNNIRSRMVKRGLKILDFTFRKRNWEKWLLVRFGKNKLQDGEHIVDRYLDTLNAFGVDTDQQGLEFFLPPDLQNEFPTLSKYIVFVLGANHEGKQIHVNQWLTLISHSLYEVVLIGGDKEKSIAEVIKTKHPSVHNFVGKNDLHTSAWYVKHSALVVTGDTGFMHVSAAFDRPTLSIWGCTSPALQMSPYMPNESNVILEPSGLDKRPCSKLGDRCKYGKGDTRCITRISEADLEEAFAFIQQRVSSTP